MTKNWNMEKVFIWKMKKKKNKTRAIKHPAAGGTNKNVREANTNKSPEVATLRPVPVIVDLDDGQPLKPFGREVDRIQ